MATNYEVKKKKKVNYEKKRINQWKHRGLILRENETYEDIYKIYKNSTHCDNCKIKFIDEQNNPSQKCLDHCHNTGFFRFILCRGCNMNKFRINKSELYQCQTGHHNIYIDTSAKYLTYKFSKTINKKEYCKRNKNKILILCYKYIFLLKFRAGLI